MYCLFPNAVVSRNACISYCQYTILLDPSWRADTTTRPEIHLIKLLYMSNDILFEISNETVAAQKSFPHELRKVNIWDPDNLTCVYPIYCLKIVFCCSTQLLNNPSFAVGT